MSEYGVWISKRTYVGMMVTMIVAALVGYARRTGGGTEFGKQASRLGGRRFRDTEEALMAISRLAANARAQFLSSWDVSQCAVGSC
jgi:hypothetical protein